MKRILCILLTLAILLAGCGKTEKDWQEQYDLGMRYLSEGDYEEAILAFSAAIEIDDSRPEAYMARAEAYISIGKPEEALKDYKKAYKIIRNNDEYEDMLEDLEEEIEELEELIEEIESQEEEEAGQETEKKAALISGVYTFNGDTLLYSYTMTYTQTGMLQEVTRCVYENDGTEIERYTETYSYNENGNLTHVDYNGGEGYSEYTYDDQGRLISKIYVHDIWAEYTYTYDEMDRMIYSTAVYNSGMEETEYIYYENGLLQEVNTRSTYYGYDGEETIEIFQMKYEYGLDERNRVVSKRRTEDSYSNLSTYSYYEGAILEENFNEYGDYSYSHLEIVDASGESCYKLYIDSIAEINADNGYLIEIFDDYGMSHLVTYLGEEPGNAEPETEPGSEPEREPGIVGGQDSVSYEIQTEDKSYYDESGVMKVEFSYDMVVVQGDSAGITAINSIIEADAAAFLSYFTEADLAENAEYCEILGDDACLFYTATPVVTHNADGILSIQVYTDWWMGGVFNSNSYGMTFDLNTGEKLGIGDLFKGEDSALAMQIKDTAWEYLYGFYGTGLFEDAYDTLYGLALEDFLFYISEGELIVTFPTYMLAPGAAGSLTVPTGMYID